MSIAPTNRVSAQQSQLNRTSSHNTEDDLQANDLRRPSTSQTLLNKVQFNSNKTHEHFKWLSEQARDHFFAQANNAQFSKIEGVEQPPSTTTAELTHALQTLIASAAANTADFNTLLAQSFGDNYNAESAEAIRQQSLNGDFSWMPKIQVVNAQVLSDNTGTQQNDNGLGAYSAQSDTIYLSQQLLEGDFNQALAVLIEETGHALDARINTLDTAGDEGAVFSQLLLGEHIGSEQLSLLQAENDHGSITVDGKELEVEYSIFSKTIRRIGRQIDDNFIQPTKKEIERVGTRIDENVIQPIKEETQRFRRRVDENILQPLQETAQVVARGAEALIQATFIRPAQELWRGAKGYISTFEHLIKGEFKGAWNKFIDTTVNGATALIRIPLEQGAILLHTTVSALDALQGNLEIRKLNATEVNYLRGIFGSSIDYSEVRIQSGGTKEQLGLRANVVGNDIFMPQETSDGLAIFNADGTMTPDGLSLLSHEAAHVWQYQQEGTSYIGESLLGQINHSLLNDITGAPDPYDWFSDVASGVEFEDLGPEQQAEVAAVIGEAIALNASDIVRDPSTPFTDSNLAAAIGIELGDLPDGLYASFLRAHAYLIG